MSIKLPIYMDNHSTTPLDPRVFEVMTPFFLEKFGNASSRSHSFGWEAEAAVEKAREEICRLIGAEDPKEIVFTSGATESNNLAIKGAADFYQSKGKHLITLETEHKATLDAHKSLEKRGFSVTYLKPQQDGLIDLTLLKAAITDQTILVSIMHANNEIGVVQPMQAIGEICRERGVLFFSDAVQSAGKIPVNVRDFNVDLLSLSAHKMYGPKGIGALWVRRSKPRVRISPFIDGGGHERGMRSGTLNVPGIVGFGAAARIAYESMASEAIRLTKMRDRLWSGIQSRLDYVFVNGSMTERLPGNLNVSFAYVEGESILMALKDIAVSSGSACTSASLEPSYVLKALGVGEELAHTSIRFGLGRFNTEAEIDYVIEIVGREIKRLRDMSPLYEMVLEGVDLSTVQWSSAH